MVPVIVNAILNEHQLVIDIVAFVIKGDFHRSRLGEKQRGKILAGWVTRKMRTIAQYSIRDPNGSDNPMMISEEPANRASMSMSIGMRGPGSTKGSMLGLTAQLNSMQLQQQQQQIQAQQMQQQQQQQQQHHSNNFSQSHLPSPNDYPQYDDKTPTEARHSFLPPGSAMSSSHQPMDYSPIDRAGPFHTTTAAADTGPGDHNYQQQTYGNAQVPDILRAGPQDVSEPFYSDSQPYDYTYQNHQQNQYERQGSGRWSFDDDEQQGSGGGGGGGGGLRVANFDDSDVMNDGHGHGSVGGGAEGGGLRVANRSSGASEASWTRDALAGLDFVGGKGN
jgi:hypothetical protein